MADEVVVARLGASGDGVIDGPDGPVYLPGMLPGERVTIERDGRGVGVLSRLTDSPERIAPFCPYFDRCGGCVAQHVGPELYRSWKRDKLVTAMSRAGLSTEVEPLLDAHGDGRRRVTFHAREIEGEMQVGFMERGSHRLVAIERCPITVAGLAKAAPAARSLAQLLKGVRKPIDIAVTSALNGLDVDLRGLGPLNEGRRQKLIAAAGTLGLARLSLHGEILIEPSRPVVRMGRADLSPPPGSFLQATAAGEDALGNTVFAGAAGARRIADLFAGCGPFSVRLAEASEVHAVDSDRKGLEALDRAARESSGLRRITTEARDLFRRPLLPPELDRYDAVVLDPPRAGAEAQVRQLVLSSCGTVIMVSCDPGTFARDAAVLVGSGFRIERVLPIDQFKWSSHLEVVGVFRQSRKKRRR